MNQKCFQNKICQFQDQGYLNNQRIGLLGDNFAPMFRQRFQQQRRLQLPPLRLLQQFHLQLQQRFSHAPMLAHQYQPLFPE
jgi:hypothetical protein